MWIGKVSMFKVKTSSLLKQVYFKFCSWNSSLMSETVRNLGSGLGTRSHCGIHKLCQASLAKKCSLAHWPCPLRCSQLSCSRLWSQPRREVPGRAQRPMNPALFKPGVFWWVSFSICEPVKMMCGRARLSQPYTTHRFQRGGNGKEPLHFLPNLK